MRASKRIGITCSVLAHFCEDVISCAIDNAKHSSNWFTTQTLAQRTNKRNAATYSRLKQQVDARFVCCSKQFRTVRGNQCLVRRNNRLARGKCFQNQSPSFINATHQLNDQVNRGVAHNKICVLCQYICNQRTSMRCSISNRHASNFQPNTTAGRNGVGLLFHQLYEGGANSAMANHADANNVCCHTFTLLAFMPYPSGPSPHKSRVGQPTEPHHCAQTQQVGASLCCS